jgi:hypothetical protein
MGEAFAIFHCSFVIDDQLQITRALWRFRPASCYIPDDWSPEAAAVAVVE